ncbi:MAG: metal-sulfur cluster assembly factor, partial [Candidatus Hydrothermarchaeaceae archaeon]
MRTVTEEEVIEALRNVMDPELRRCLVELGMVKDIEIRDGRVGITISLTIPGCPLKEDIKRDIEEKILELPGIEEVDVSITSMTKRERKVLFEELTAEEGREPLVYH